MKSEMVFSDELPVNPVEEKRLIDKCAEIAEEAKKHGAFEVTLRSIEYCGNGDGRQVNVEYGDGSDSRLNLTLVQRGDCLRRAHSWHFSGSNVKFTSALFNAVEHSLCNSRFSLRQLCDSKTDSEFQLWLAKFAEVFKRYLPDFTDVDAASSIVKLRTRRYKRLLSDNRAEIAADFSVCGKSAMTLEFICRKGKLYFIRGGVDGWNADTEHLVDAANSALDSALKEMRSEDSRGVDFQYSRNSEKWTRVSTILPKLEVTATFARKPAHPFLAEYYRKIILRKPGGPEKTFRLKINCGGRTNVRLFSASFNGTRYLRLKDHSWMNTLFRLSDLKVVPPNEAGRGCFIGAFMGVTTRLRFVAVGDEDAESVFKAAAERGYPLPLRDYRGLDAPEESGE
jgi:hypothetical protein